MITTFILKDLGYMDCQSFFCKGLCPVMWNLVDICDMFVSVDASTECRDIEINFSLQSRF
jgi:hypothetical protein